MYKVLRLFSPAVPPGRFREGLKKTVDKKLKIPIMDNVMAGNYKNIPIEQDLAVLARCVLSFSVSKSKDDLAKIVLAQRVIIEKSKRYRMRRSGPGMIGIHQRISDICTDLSMARVYAGKVNPDCALAKVWPNYLAAELII